MPYVGTHINRVQDSDGSYHLQADREIWFKDEYDYKTWYLGQHADQDSVPVRGWAVEVYNESNDEKYYEINLGISNNGETN